jgi:hypothetical protein
MKRIYLVPFFSLIAGFSTAQLADYEPLPNDSVIWSGAFASIADGSTYYKTSIWGDTTINSTAYTKVYQHTDVTGVNLPTAPIGDYIGSFRQEVQNEKMFFLDLADIEYDISVDHSVNLGDQLVFPPHYKALFVTPIDEIDSVIVIGLDSVIENSRNWRYYELEVYHPDYPNPFVGIYRIGLGLYAISGGGQTLWEVASYCYRDSSTPFFGSDICSFPTALEEEAWHNAQILISPNPTSGNLSIQIPAYKRELDLAVHTIAGKCVIRTKIVAENTQLDLGTLSSGMYLVSVIGGGVSRTTRVVVQ